MNNLHFDGWFAYYKGMIYANGKLDVHARINNKIVIDNMRPRRGKG